MSARLYHPFASGALLAAAVGEGGVESYESENAPLLVLPALSVQLPGADAVAESGPPYELPTQVSIPETASVPANVTATAWLYQPFASAARAAVPTGMVGSVLSIFTVATLLTSPHVK